jgi:hypothetical protein
MVAGSGSPGGVPGGTEKVPLPSIAVFAADWLNDKVKLAGASAKTLAVSWNVPRKYNATDRVDGLKLSVSVAALKVNRLAIAVENSKRSGSGVEGPVRLRVSGDCVTVSPARKTPTKSLGSPNASAGRVLTIKSPGKVIEVAVSKSLPGERLIVPIGTNPKVAFGAAGEAEARVAKARTAGIKVRTFRVSSFMPWHLLRKITTIIGGTTDIKQQADICQVGKLMKKSGL